MSDLSRVEQLLRNALGEDIYEVTPQSRVEALLVELNDLIEGMGSSVSPEDIATAVAAYLDEHLTNPTNPPIDTSLAIAGAAADAKEVGDRLSTVKEELSEIISIGKNIYDKTADNTVMGYFSGNGNVGVIAANANSCIVWVEITGGKTYTVSKTAGKRFQIGETTVQPAVGVSVTSLASNGTSPVLTATTSANAKYLAVIIWNGNYDTTITLDQMKASVQIEEGSTATEYEPYGYTASDSVARLLASQALSSLSALAFLGDNNLVALNTDLNALSDGVVYSDFASRTNTLVNCPINNTNCKIITFTRYSTYKMQICVGGNGRVYFRTNSGVGYIPWRELGNNIESLSIAPSIGISPVYGEELCPALSAFTGTDATWSNSAWSVDDGGSISTSLTVEADEAYLVTFTVADPYTGADNDGVPAYLDVTLGSDSVRFFAAIDAYWYVVLTPTTSGTATFSVESVNHWTGKISGISIKKVTEYAPYLLELYSQKVRYTTGNNLSIGGLDKLAFGEANTAYGKDAQVGVEAGRWNTAVGAYTQRFLRNGTGNTAIGSSAQANIETGCYNNCVGNGAQMAITTGNWNNAFGNEAQLQLTEGCNNVNIGRRSGTAMRNGNYNTHIGTWTGFTGVNTQEGVDDGRNTISASFQTLIGGKARQIDHQSDYLTAIGYGTQGDEKAVAIGANAIAKGENSVAIGYGVQTTNDDQVAIGSDGQSIVLAGKLITFNQDGTVTWTATN